jgi:hypothetical protein
VLLIPLRALVQAPGQLVLRLLRQKGWAGRRPAALLVPAPAWRMGWAAQQALLQV